MPFFTSEFRIKKSHNDLKKIFIFLVCTEAKNVTINMLNTLPYNIYRTTNNRSYPFILVCCHTHTNTCAANKYTLPPPRFRHHVRKNIPCTIWIIIIWIILIKTSINYTIVLIFKEFYDFIL